MSFTDPVIRGAEIIAQTKVEITPGQPLTYHWEGYGFEVHVPAGAIPADGAPVTMSVQASIVGNYKLPDDGVLVSGVYWIALHPPNKFAEGVTVVIHHCSDADPALSFSTAKCTQKLLPYTFKPLSGGSFSDTGIGNIKVNHFSAIGILGRRKDNYAIFTYYIPKELNIYDAHITVVPKIEPTIKVCRGKLTWEALALCKCGDIALVRHRGSLTLAHARRVIVLGKHKLARLNKNR